MRRRRIFWGVAVLEIQISRCDGAETFGVLECFSSICVFGFAFSGANAFAFAFAVASRSMSKREKIKFEKKCYVNFSFENCFQTCNFRAKKVSLFDF